MQPCQPFTYPNVYAGLFLWADFSHHLEANTREAEMKLEKEDWGKNREINVRKRKIQQGIDPDLELKMKQKAKRKFFKKQKKERLKMKAQSDNPVSS